MTSMTLLSPYKADLRDRSRDEARLRNMTDEELKAARTATYLALGQESDKAERDRLFTALTLIRREANLRWELSNAPS